MKVLTLDFWKDFGHWFLWLGVDPSNTDDTMLFSMVLVKIIAILLLWLPIPVTVLSTYGFFRNREFHRQLDALAERFNTKAVKAWFTYGLAYPVTDYSGGNFKFGLVPVRRYKSTAEYFGIWIAPAGAVDVFINCKTGYPAWAWKANDFLGSFFGAKSLLSGDTGFDESFRVLSSVPGKTEAALSDPEFRAAVRALFDMGFESINTREDTGEMAALCSCATVRVPQPPMAFRLEHSNVLKARDHLNFLAMKLGASPAVH